jgi:hypothetical protein
MKGRALLYLLLVVFGATSATLGATTYLFYDKYNKERLEREAGITADEVALEDTSDEEDLCAPVMNQFTGDEVNISFEYPATWGEATEEITTAANGGYLSGSTFEISFSENPRLVLYGTSSDFEIGGVGDPCPMHFLFGGDEDMTTDSICDTDVEDYDPTGLGHFYFSCADEELGDSAISYYYGPSTTCMVFGFQKIVDINSPQAEYPGIRAVMSLVSTGDLRMVYRADRITSGEDGVLEEMFLGAWNGVYDELSSESYENYLMQQQLEELETFLETIEFVE